VTTLVLRLALAPSIVLLASLVQRRLGPRPGGRVVGFPLTTGPFLAVICLQYGTAAAARAAAGVISGQMVVVGFCLGYGHLAARVRPLWALAGALVAGALAGTALSAVHPTWLATALVITAVAVGLYTWPVPPPPASPAEPVSPAEPSGDGAGAVAFRMAVTGGLVAGLAAAARVVGSYLAGTLSSMPVILSVVVPAAHRSHGPIAATEIVRGALVSIGSAVIFITVVAYTVESLNAVIAFALASVAVFATSLLPWYRLTPVRP
jgi:hypothetical protein